MTDQILIRIEPELKAKLYKLARAEGIPASRMVRELIADYVRDRDIGAYIDDLWDRMGDKLRSQGTKLEDIDSAIRASRKAKT
jgi:predicted DNA-binding protein